MLLFRRTLRFSAVCRWVGEDYGNVFKAYLHQAEQIDKIAKEKAFEDLKQEGSPNQNQKPLTPIEEFLKPKNIKHVLIQAASSIQVQLIIEELLLEASTKYKAEKDTIENAVNPGQVIMKLMRVWESSPELKITDMFLPTIIRTIWANPYMKNAPDFGTFKRISKEAEGKHSPFIYGPLSEKTYIALAEGVGNERPGIKIVRRILDHMNVNDHTPSNELLKVLVNESIKGKWPEILLRILQYSHRKGVTVDHAIWMDAISYYRYCLNFFETGLQCIELALKNNVRADWDLIELYANKYLKHEMVPPVELLVKNVKSAMVKQAKNTQDYPQRLFDFNQKFFKCLVRYEEEKKATQYLLEYAKDEKYSEVSIEMGFKHFEEVKDARNSGEFFKQVVAKEGFVYTPKFIAEALRMCSAMKGEASNIVLILRDVILADNLLSSPFSINMIIMNFGYTEDWDKLYQFLLKIKDSKMQINKFTVPTAKKVIAACKDSVMTKRINELVVEFNNLIAA